ncbi:MAG: UvrD-helicase domain-containing protein [Chitinispirillaceae bacterium]|nr:UvrD-helicase domain-containing protein [Chitinispirillaceae bacterium]
MTKNTEGGIISRLVLNRAQQEAVIYNEGSQLVFAGAGTGKTRVLTAKIAYLIDLGVSPKQIFAATFTNKAANEMRERVEKFTNSSVEEMWLGTFHSLCARLLRRESKHLGFPQYFSIYDRSDQESLLKKARKEAGSDERSIALSVIVNSISALKQNCITPEEAMKNSYGFYEKEIANIYCIYQRMLKEQAAMDFDDLLMNTVILLRENESILKYYNEKFRYILIDEFQDTNSAQILLIKLLGFTNQIIFAVGDDDQSIYEWRGAKIENILNFSSSFPNVKIFKLEQNYRSTGAILDFANEVIKGNKNRTPKKLWTQKEYGIPVTLIRYRDDRQEAADIVETIFKEIKNGLKGREIAILFRTNAQSKIFEDEFRKRKIPYMIVGGMSFYERSEIKDCLAYLRLLVNPADNVSFERIYNTPARGLGEKALEILYELSKKQGQSLLTTLLTNDPEIFGSRFVKGFSELKELFLLLKESLDSGKKVYEILKDVVEYSGYIEMLDKQDTEESFNRKQNILELENDIFNWSERNPNKTLADFLTEVSLITDIDTYEVREEAVNMMTMHSAKGLEFKRVFIVGLEDGIIPSKRNFDDEAKIEEERRLLYVAVTRAMEKLTCSFAEMRYFFGELVPQIKSRFLMSIDPLKYEFVDKKLTIDSLYYVKEGIKPDTHPISLDKREEVKQKKTLYNEFSQQQELAYDDFSQEEVEFRRGQYVKHSKYGKGKIMDVSGFGDDMRITVLFNDGSRRKLMAKFAKLERF